MRKFYTGLCMLLISIAAVSCSDDDKEPAAPPATQVVASYAADKLSATMGGEAVAEDAAVNIVREANNTTTIKLVNIVPGVGELSVPNAIITSTEGVRSGSVSRIDGYTIDEYVGYTVKVVGTITDDALNAEITVTDLTGDAATMDDFFSKIYKGQMSIAASDGSSKAETTHRIYSAKPYRNQASTIKLTINDVTINGVKVATLTLDTIKTVKRGDINSLRISDRTVSITGIGDAVVNLRGMMLDNIMKLHMTIVTPQGKINIDYDGNQVTESTETTSTITVTGEAVLGEMSVSGNTYKFSVWESTPAEKLILTPQIEIPATATLDSVAIYNATDQTYTRIEPGTPIDFSKIDDKSYVAYFVMPEDIRYQSKKMLYIVRISEPDPVYTFETWTNGEPEGLATSNLAGTFFPIFGINVPTPVAQGSDNAAVITTSRTVATTQPTTLVPGVTAGTMFTGKFQVDIFNTLKSTKFGLPFSKRPVKFKVTYKYEPGAIFYKSVTLDSLDNATGNTRPYNDTEVVPGGIDSCSINAYLYEVSSVDESLDGTNINSSDKVVLRATLADGSAKATYQDVEIDFVQVGTKAYDPKKLYKLAIVCSSSKKGDLFMGADGSQLTIKRLEVVSGQEQ